MVVLPAASRPTIKILISFFAKSRLNSFVNVSPIFFSNQTSQADQISEILEKSNKKKSKTRDIEMNLTSDPIRSQENETTERRYNEIDRTWSNRRLDQIKFRSNRERERERLFDFLPIGERESPRVRKWGRRNGGERTRRSPLAFLYAKILGGKLSHATRQSHVTNRWIRGLGRQRQMDRL